MKIAIIGKIGSGKSTLAKKLNDEYGFKIIHKLNNDTMWRTIKNNPDMSIVIDNFDINYYDKLSSLNFKFIYLNIDDNTIYYNLCEKYGNKLTIEEYKEKEKDIEDIGNNENHYFITNNNYKIEDIMMWLYNFY